MESKYYKSGVYCPLCYGTRTKEQIKRSMTRQSQIDKRKNEVSKWSVRTRYKLNCLIIKYS